MQSLHIKITPAPPNPQEMKPQYPWNQEDLNILEQFFELKVAAPPYRQTSMCGFLKMFSVPPAVLKDLCQIILLELRPEVCKSMGFHWNVQFCLRATFSFLPMVPMGTAAIVSNRNKLLFFVSFQNFFYAKSLIIKYYF